MPVNVPEQEKRLVLPAKRQRAIARANTASIHMGITVVPEAAERHFWMSHSTGLHANSLGAVKGNMSFTGAVHRARAPSCPLPLSCSQVMYKVRM